MINLSDIHCYPVEDKIKNETNLWKMVIVQAFIDLSISSNLKKEYQVYRREAKNWLLGRSKNFYDVCSMASLDPSSVRQKAIKIINRSLK